MYCAERSESTRIRERVQRYVVGTSPGAALQGDSSGFSGELLSSASGFFGAFCIVGCAQMSRLVIKRRREGCSALAPSTPPAGTGSGEGPAAPMPLSRPL